jgi:nucleoside-diphosphate-sugar epimerase
MFAKVQAGQEIEIWGDGSQTRTYMHVTDSVLAILDMIEANKHHVLNIGTTEAMSVLSLARMICAALGKPERIRFNRTKSGGRRSRTLDVTKLNDIITFEPRSLQEGLAETADWYRNVYLAR